MVEKEIRNKKLKNSIVEIIEKSFKSNKKAIKYLASR